MQQAQVNPLPEPSNSTRATGGQPQRRGRALIGWMAADTVEILLNGLQAAATSSIEALVATRAARDAVAARQPGLDQADLIESAPPELIRHVAQLRHEPLVAPFFAGGWVASVVDLRRICAVQPHVLTDDVDDRVAGADPGDIASLAAITLPMPATAPLPAQHDPVHKTWIISSRNHNLRIVAPFQGEVQPGTIGLGFGLNVAPSMIQVARLGDRYLLRDGYHRAVGLLRRGISHVPAFVRTFESFEQLALNPGMLPQDAYLGDRPPTIMDFLDDTVAADVSVPSTQKMILIQATEITPFA
jgi:hypothetical protein